MKVVDSDAFLDMPPSTQSLYFHLNMRADDDGVVDNPRKIMRMIGAADDDMKLLIAKRFCLAFDSGIVVIKHWWIHNTLRKDRYEPTAYQEEFSRLYIKENRAYTDKPGDGNHLATKWQPNGNQLATQYSRVENSKDTAEMSIGENRGLGEGEPTEPLPDHLRTGIESIDGAIALGLKWREKKGGA